MSEKINTGWLIDFEDGYFAPKTLFTKVLNDTDGIDLSTYLTSLKKGINDSTIVVDLTKDGSGTFSSGIVGVQGQLNVPNGGTGRDKLDKHYLLIGNDTGKVTMLAPSSNSTYLLASNGTSLDPSYKALSTSWISSASEGPTLQIEVGGEAACQKTIPTATESQSGVVIVGDQTFKGKKTFASGIDLNKQSITNVDGIMSNDIATYYFIDNDENVIAYIDANGLHTINIDTNDKSSGLSYNLNNSLKDIYEDIFGLTIKTALSTSSASTLAEYIENTNTLITNKDTAIRSIKAFVDLAKDTDSTNAVTIGGMSGGNSIGVTGVLDVLNGGTGRNSLTKHNLLIGNDTGAVTLLPPVEDNLHFLVSNANQSPSYKKLGSRWINGTTEGPVYQLEIGGSVVDQKAIPTANLSQSGVVTTDVQAFSGRKTFINGIDVNKTEITGVAGLKYSDASTFYFTDSSDYTIAYIDNNGVHTTNITTNDTSTNLSYDVNNSFKFIYDTLGDTIVSALGSASVDNLANYITTTQALISSNDSNIRNINLAVNLASDKGVTIGKDANQIGVFGVLDVPNGGTGRSSLTAHNLLVGNGADMVGLLPPLTTEDIYNTYVLANNNGATPSYKPITNNFYGGADNAVCMQINVGNKAACSAQIPNATEASAGLVTTLKQTFKGQKIFQDSIDVNNGEITNVAGMQYNNSTFYFTDDADRVVAYVDKDGVHAINFTTRGSNNEVVRNINTTFDDIDNSLNELGQSIAATNTSLANNVTNIRQSYLKVDLTSNNAVTFGNGTSTAPTLIGVQGTLDVPNGGTGNTSFSKGKIIYAKETDELASYTTTHGNTTTPMYLNAGAPATCDQYAGGTCVTLNGAGKGATTASFYAPTSAGTSGYILKSSGTGAPTWLQTLPVTNGGTGTTTAPTQYGLIYGGTATEYDSTPAGSEGQLLQAGGTKAPSWIIVDKGDENTPIYLKKGVPTACTGLDLDTTGNAATATKFASDATITLTGNVTGTASSQHGWSIATTIAAGAVTNAMLAGSIANAKLANSKITIAGTDVSLGGSISAATLKSNLDLTDTYLPLSGGTLTGNLDFLAENKDMFITWKYSNTSTSASWRLGYIGTGAGNANYFAIESTASDSGDTWNRAMQIGMNDLAVTFSGKVTASQVYGAVWNDYAEYRSQKEFVEPGYCVVSKDNGQVSKTTKKYQACDGIVSDTFGFAIGETNNCQTPLAVAGRVLAYCEGDKYDYHAGDTVCAGPGGKVVKMTREEIQMWPDRIVGIVSEIPEYETWGSGNVKVNGRIWIKVK